MAQDRVIFRIELLNKIPPHFQSFSRFILAGTPFEKTVRAKSDRIRCRTSRGKNPAIRAVLMGTKSCTKILNFWEMDKVGISTPFSERSGGW